MKYVLVALVILLLPVSALAAVDAGEISSALPLTSTAVVLTLDATATTFDSLYICYFAWGSSDTTFAAYADSATTDTTLVNLTANSKYILFTVARDGDGKTNVSGKDTTWTLPVAIQDRSRSAAMFRSLMTDASWPDSSTVSQTDSAAAVNEPVIHDYIFDLNDVDASDYSCLFYAKTYNGVDVIATQAGDSCVASLYFYPVMSRYQTGGINDTTFVRSSTIADSVNVTSNGLTRDSVSLAVGMLYQVMVYSLTGNGKDADYEVWVTSIGGGE